LPPQRNGNGNGKRSTGARRPVGTRKRTTAGMRAQQKSGGSMTALFLVAMLLAAAVGGGFAFREEIFGPGKPPTPVKIPEGPGKPPVKPPDKLPVKPPDKLPVEPPDKLPVKPPVNLDNAAAERAISLGEALLGKMQYKPAAGAFGKVSGIKCALGLSKKASELEMKAKAFDRISTKYVKVRADAGKKTQIVVLVGGREIKGVVTKNSKGSYTVLQGTSGGGQMTYTFQAHEIKSFKQIDPAERIAELKSGVEKRVVRLGTSPTAASLVEVAVYALENGLKQEGHKLLERAWGESRKFKGKHLLSMVAEHRAAKLYAQADWYDSVSQEIFARTYCKWLLEDPEYKRTPWGAAATKLIAMMDQRKGIKNYKVTYKIEAPKISKPTKLRPLEPLPTPKTPPRVTVSSIRSKGGNLGAADKMFREGIGYYIKGRPGRPNSNYNLGQASKRFRKAVAIYEKALRADPNNSSLQSRIQDCNMKIYSCAKMSTL
jgi:tetratricopeptide (TPR) repeat protein